MVDAAMHMEDETLW